MKRVRVIGFGYLEFEGQGLYLHREDFLHGTGNVIWLNFDGTIKSSSAVKNAPNGNYVIVEGTFDANDTGHMDMFVGSLEQITRYDLWNKTSDPRRLKYQREIEEIIRKRKASTDSKP